MAVSKTKPVELIQEAYDVGQRIFGENKVQDMAAKYEVLSKDIEWHMIGHLQTNKVKYIAPFASLIHGVDSERLLQEIDKRAAQNDRIQDVLIQINISEENQKHGVMPIGAVAQILSWSSTFQNIRIRGVMGMAENTADEGVIRAQFTLLKQLFNDINANGLTVDVLSMGMSQDYSIAIECGATHVRIGSAIFGPRNY